MQCKQRHHLLLWYNLPTPQFRMIFSQFLFIDWFIESLGEKVFFLRHILVFPHPVYLSPNCNIRVQKNTHPFLCWWKTFLPSQCLESPPQCSKINQNIPFKSNDFLQCFHFSPSFTSNGNYWMFFRIWIPFFQLLSKKYSISQNAFLYSLANVVRLFLKLPICIFALCKHRADKNTHDRISKL